MNNSEQVTLSPVSSLEWIPCGYNWTGPVLGGQTSSLHDTAPLLVGYLACALAAVFYGCNFVPLKLVKTGDGIFCQWVVCASAWLVGLVVQLLRGDPQFYSLSVIGGVVWAIGNCCAIPIINLIGLSVGVTLWNCTSILVGWASSRFGLLFDICPNKPSSEAMNYTGVALCICAVIVFALVKTDIRSLTECVPKACLDPEVEEGSRRHSMAPSHNNNVPRVDDDSSIIASGHLNNNGISDTNHNNKNRSKGLTRTLKKEQVPLNGDSTLNNNNNSAAPLSESRPDEDVFLGQFSEGWRRFIGVTLALCSGCCYGLAFVPWNYVREHTIIKGYRASRSGLDYVFTQFCGVFVMSSGVFFVYAIFHKQPMICSKLIIPSFISGIMWGIATVALFIANEILSVAITFPIVGAFPGIVASVFGIFLFREISGLRSFVILGIAFTLTIAGVILTGWSKHYE